MAWQRDTEWRQGCVLSNEALNAFECCSIDRTDDTVAIVISHDCDLANDNMALEPDAEIILGQLLDKVDGNNTHAKTPRKLHLTFDSPEGRKNIELAATQKTTYPKNKLCNFNPRPWYLNEQDTATLQRWLAARYRRSAFPDPFNSILKQRSLDRRIARILEPLGHSISAVFFDLTGGEDLYELVIYLLYDTSQTPEQSEADAESAAKYIVEAFEQRLFDEQNGWQEIELVDCSPIADEAITYRQSTLLQQWRCEHLSLRTDPQQPMVED